MYTLLGDLSHDLFGGARLVYDCYEVFCESKGDVVDRVLEDVIHHMGESIDEIIAADDKSLLLVD